MNISSPHLAAITAFSLWGLYPLYWKLFTEISAWDLFAHRMVASFLTLSLILVYQKKTSAIKAIWQNRKTRYMLMASALFISANWLIYIYAVNTGKVLEASMGYFLNPLINVLFGRIILKETIRPTQWPAIALALFSILLMGVQTDLSHFPWIAIFLSLTFAAYGLIRKLTHVHALDGLAFETCFMILPVLAYWSLQETTPLTIFGQLEAWKLLLLGLSGLVTCVPLILMAHALRNLRLQTVGFIQYLSPSLKFICGLLILHEPLSQGRLLTFLLIWIALLWYTGESFIFKKRNQKKAVIIPE